MNVNTKHYHYSNWDKLNDLGFFVWFVIFIVSTGVIALERYTPVYINNFYVRLFFYMLSATIFVSWLGWMFFGFKAIKNRIYIFVGVLVIVLSKALLTWGGDWKTQIVLYKNDVDPARTIEFQMRADPFNFGYRKRIVERLSTVPFFDYVEKVDTTVLNKSVWHRVDLRVNKLNLKDFNDLPVSH
jgi:hypothetical protein